ncbi:MAG TPA: hypothetical protein VFV67_10270 [Actinophytocola sp.]|nr:hypothetical protein [Actinophytocola sp.]HEU5471027.1 hypothetical protein [Actinophytocola sp.]
MLAALFGICSTKSVAVEPNRPEAGAAGGGLRPVSLVAVPMRAE